MTVNQGSKIHLVEALATHSAQHRLVHKSCSVPALYWHANERILSSTLKLCSSPLSAHPERVWDDGKEECNSVGGPKRGTIETGGQGGFTGADLRGKSWWTEARVGRAEEGTGRHRGQPRKAGEAAERAGEGTEGSQGATEHHGVAAQGAGGLLPRGAGWG